MATRKSTCILFGILIMAAWLFGSVTQAGAETYTFKCRDTQHIVKVQAIEVGDVPGHVIGVIENAGVQSCDDGSIATESVKARFEYINGSGPVQGYTLTTSEDGSTTWGKWQMTTTLAPDGKTSTWEGTSEFIKGTGRFEGIKGGGTFTGKRLAPVPGAGAQVYSDSIGTFTLPSK